MDNFVGFVTLGETKEGVLLVRNASGVPINADSFPTFRVYGPEGPMTNGTGTCSFLHTDSVEDATNASPIVITSTAHGLETGMRVTIAGVLGNTAANGTFTVTKVNANQFSLQTSVGSGVYTSGGTWNVTGAYAYEVPALGADGYEAGQSQKVLFTYTIAAAAMGQVHTFMVS